MCGWACHGLVSVKAHVPEVLDGPHGLVSVKALFQCVDGPMLWYLLRLCSSVVDGPHRLVSC